MNFATIRGFAIAFALTGAAGCGGSAKCAAAPDTKQNCTTNLDTAKADLNACAAGDADDMCTALTDKDLKQLEKLCPANGSAAKDVRAQVDACKGKTLDSEACKAIEASLAKIVCE